MEISPFFYRILKVNENEDSCHLLGTAFPVTPNGGLISCRHVLDVPTTDNEFIAVYDNEAKKIVPIDPDMIMKPNNPDCDMAYIPNSLGREKEEFFPLLMPQDVIIGEDVYSYGYFLSSGSEVKNANSREINQGYFKGNIVNFSQSTKTHGGLGMSLSFAVVEGLSGSPVITYHNGPKVVGFCYGNLQSRIMAHEVIEYKDKVMDYKETINRIVEFGRAHHVASIVGFMQEIGHENFVLSSEHLNIPGLSN